jgi:hypothetical protein
MQANGETQGQMPSLNDIISSGNNQEPNQVSYSYTRTVQQDGNPPSSTTTTNIREDPNSTTKVVRKVVTSQQPATESSYYSKKVTTKTTTTTTTTRGGPSTTQANTRYSNAASAGNRNQSNSSTYTRPSPQTTKVTTTTTRGQYGQPSSQVYRGNQNKITTQPRVIGNSQSFAGNKYQPKRPEQPQSYKPKARSPEPGSIKRKTINRGNPVENVQITHIIYTSVPADFHITEELNLDNLNSAPIQISKTDRAKLQRSGKVSATCSCDGVEIAQPKKVNLKGNTTHYQHARGIGMTNDTKENINPTFYSSEIKKLDPIYKEKDKEKIEYVETFRSSGKVYNNQTSPSKPTTTKTSTYNRSSNYKPNQNYSRGGATSTSGRGGMASSMSNRGGSSNVNNRGGMGSTVKTTTTVYRGSNRGGDGEIIKETNTKVSMGSRSNKNQSQPTVTTTHERKVYNQKNFFNK